MNNHMSLKLVGANSSLELNSPITSIYLQEELTGLTTLPGIRETKGMNIGMDGGWTSAQFYEPRLITIKGVIANQDVAVVEQRRKQLIQLLSEKRLALEFQTEAGNHYTMDVVVAGVQMPLSKVLTASYFQINLRADDPLIYDNNALAELEAILRRSSSASSGFTINFPINFQLGTSESRPTIDNFGSSVIYPTITLTGPLTTPEIVNITTNMAFTIDEVLGAGTYTASGIRGAIDQEGSIDTYSGNPIQATRDAESPISKFSLYGNAEQTTYSGKNLFDTSTATLVNKYVNTNGAMTSASDWLGTDSYFEVQPNTTYTFSAKNQGARFLWGEYETTSGSDFISPRHESTGTFTTGSSTHYIRFSTNNANATDLQIERGSTATSYEPFVGGIPAPNPEFPMPISTVTGENVVKIEGKNLIDNTALDYAYSNVASRYNTLTTIDTGIRYATTYSSGAPIVLFNVMDASNMVGKTVRLSANYGQGGSIVLFMSNENGASNLVLGTSTGSGVAMSHTITSSDIVGHKYLAYGLRIVLSQGSSSVDYTNLIMTVDNEDTAYEPYQAQEFEVNLGKNLFDLKGFLDSKSVTYTEASDGTITFTSVGALYSEPFQFSQDDITVSIQGIISNLTGTNFRIQLINKAGNAVGEISPSTTTREGLSACKVRFNWSDSGTFSVKNIQVERGSQATSYSAYFTPIELAKIGNYQDRIYKDSGKWYIEKQVGKYSVSLTGLYTLTGGLKGAICSPANKATSGGDALCDRAVKTVGGNIWAGSFYENPANFMFVGTADDDATSIKSKYDGAILYYALATPTTTEITEQSLIDQLDAILEAHLYGGLNNISNVTISPNLVGDLEIKTGQTLTVIDSLSIVGSSGTAEIDLGGSELAMVGSVADELTINGTTGAVTKTARIGKIESYAGETITTDYISTSGGLDSDATIYYVLPSSSTSVINTLDSTALAAFNGVVASGGVSAQTNIGSISVDVTTVTAQDVAVVDTKQHTVTINGVGAYSKFSGDWLTLDVGLNELQLITENNTDTGSAVIKYRVGYMGV